MRKRLFCLGVLLAVLAGCATRAKPSVPSSTEASADSPLAQSSIPTGDQAILHVLNRIGYGPRPGDLERVRAVGLARYIEQQLGATPGDAPGVEAILSGLSTLRREIPELLAEYPRPKAALAVSPATGGTAVKDAPPPQGVAGRPARIVAELQAAKAVRAVMSEGQLREVMVDFWLNHFNAYANKGEVRWYVTSFERDAIRPHALGKFRDLVDATAHHPAMLFYLDNWLSVKPGFVAADGPNKGRRTGLNENYARELMELHTLGVDGGYTQEDVTQVARAFTGWTIEQPRVSGRFIFRPTMHDSGVKLVLGHRIVNGGERDGERVIDILTRHPATARFIATKLCRYFVSDDPPTALVERVATTYRQTDGDIRAMLRTVLTAPEFYAADVSQAKIKKPFEFVVSAVRAVGGTVDARGGYALALASARIGEALYEARPPTGYGDRAEDWINTGALLARLNFALRLGQGGIPGVRVDAARLVMGASQPEGSLIVRQLLTAMAPQALSDTTRRVLIAQLGDAGSDLPELIALVIGSPEFQRR